MTPETAEKKTTKAQMRSIPSAACVTASVNTEKEETADFGAEAIAAVGNGSARKKSKRKRIAHRSEENSTVP